MTRTTQERELVWEKLGSSKGGMFGTTFLVHRAKVPGGWLIAVMSPASGVTFYPDPEHEWDGGSLA